MHAGEYVAETGLYYLGSRYYDPETGRFLNADGLLGANGDILSYNLFAYCSNNPVNYYDPFGCSARHASRLARNKIMKAATGSTNAEVYRTRNNTPSKSHTGSPVDDFKNSDGSYSLYDSKRHDPDGIFHEQILSAKVSKPSFDLKNDKLTLGSVKASVMTGGWEWENFDLSLLDAGTAKFSAGYDGGVVDVSAMASIWTPSATIKLGNIKVTLSFHAGSVGGKFKLGENGFDVAGATGWGGGLSVSW